MRKTIFLFITCYLIAISANASSDSQFEKPISKQVENVLSNPLQNIEFNHPGLTPDDKMKEVKKCLYQCRKEATSCKRRCDDDDYSCESDCSSLHYSCQNTCT